MAENSAIEWTDSTFNPWIGCTKVGPGCDHCYAEVRDKRHLHGPDTHWGPGAQRVRTKPSTWAALDRYERDGPAFFAKHGRRQRVFVASLSDWADNEVPDQWRLDLAGRIKRCPNVIFLMLTKRIGRVPQLLALMFPEGVPENVRIGATIVNEEEWRRDSPKIAEVALTIVGKERVFLSMEPLLGPVDLPGGLGHIPFHKIVGWVIVGGESGAGARPMHPEWVRAVRDQCAAAGVPFLFKQWGEWLPGTQYTPACVAADPDLEQSRFDCMDWDGERFEESGGGWTDDLDENAVFRVGKKRAGRLLDGAQHDGVLA